MRVPASLQVLRNREFRLLYAGQAVSLVGDGMVIVAIPFAVFAIGGSVSTVGFVLAAGQAPLAALILAGGVVADRLPRRGVMLASDLVRMAVMGTGAALLVAGVATVWELVLLQVGYGVASGFFYPASSGLLPTLVEGELLQPANALRGIADASGRLVGPALAGVIVATASPGWALGADAVTFAVSAATLAGLRPPAHVPAERQHFLRELHEGWREFASRTWVWATVALAGGIGSVLFAARMVLGPEVARTQLGGAGAWAAITAGAGVGALLGGVVALHVRPRRPRVAMTLGWTLVVGTPLALAIPAPLAVIVATGVLAGIGLSLGQALWETALAQSIPGDALSRVSAYDWFGSLALGPIAMVAIGPLAAALGTRTVLIAVALVFLVGDLAILALRDVRSDS